MWRADTVSEWLIKWTDGEMWHKLIVQNNLDIINGGHLWFLPALVYAYLLLYLIDHFDLYRWAYYLVPIYILIKIIYCTYIYTKGLTWHDRGNFYMGAIPYVLLGNYLAARKEIWKKISNISLMTIVIIGAMMVVVSELFAYPISLTELGIVPASIALFIWAINNGEKSLCGPMQVLGDKYSLYVYIVHVILGGLLGIFVYHLSIGSNTWYRWSEPLLVAALSIVVGMAKVKLSRQKK